MTIQDECKCSKDNPEWDMKFFCRKCGLEIDRISTRNYIEWVSENVMGKYNIDIK